MKYDDIKVGDVVRLKSAEVKMTVEHCNHLSEMISCMWFEDQKLRKADFIPEILEPVSCMWFENQKTMFNPQSHRKPVVLYNIYAFIMYECIKTVVLQDANGNDREISAGDGVYYLGGNMYHHDETNDHLVLLKITADDFVEPPVFQNFKTSNHYNNSYGRQILRDNQ